MKAGSAAEDLVEQTIRYYAPEAVGSKADGLLAAEILVEIFDPQKSATALPKRLQEAALAIITPELLAAFPSEAQTALVVVSSSFSSATHPA